MQSALANAVTKSQVFVPSLARMYRAKARSELESNDVESFSRTVEKAWLFHVRGHTEECEHLFWTKGIVLQNSGNHDGAHLVFKSLASAASHWHALYGLYELGMYREAAFLLNDALVNSRSNKLLHLAQLSRCLMSLRDERGNAKKVYARLEVYSCDVYYKSQALSPLEIRFVEQVLHRQKSFNASMTKRN
eukprot:TRINITY_DN14515_c1_g1_i1.p1 TRINITY_DN14515_c1_g1~~TRINITY_DN14515_c1_g1_i1.p1  ORF type:complete len:191 (+),score=39.54 TRINITY_DN14515_c1_g1_i1:276-848(+)